MNLNQEELANQIIKLAKKFVNTHPKYWFAFDSKEDYESELLTRFFEKYDEFDESKGKLSTWSYMLFKQISIKKVKKYLKRKNLLNTISLEDKDENGISLKDTLKDEEDPFEKIEEKIFTDYFYEKLNPYLSEEFKKHYFEYKTLEEIAKDKKVTRQCIQMKIALEIRNLQKAVEENNIDSLGNFENGK